MSSLQSSNRPLAIVTGASRGIGRAVAEGFVADDYTVILIAREPTRVASLADHLNAQSPGRAVAWPLDVADERSVFAAIEAIAENHRRIDVLFNGAGVVHRGTSSIGDADQRRLLETNLLGAMNLIRAVTPVMKQARAGYIIDVASRSAIYAKAGNGGYAASKAALRAYGDALYQELAKDGIKVTTLCPSYVDTEQSARQLWLPDDAKIPPFDIYASVRFLLALSKAASVKELVIDCSHVVAHGEQYV
ncbi:MAG TPA: SDR family oxidoreductase [Paraburkholderia sp.]|jgi:NAD(P)-dependent dehydrogenase (short-subunit alcohol dehydrogenase family)|nr:SDR family oxidoreductase [Paraburkholderia sp.]